MITLNKNSQKFISTIRETYEKGKENEKISNKHSAQSVINYRDCGRALNEIKETYLEEKYQLKRFYEDIEKEFGIKERMVQRYIKVGVDDRTKDVDVEFFSKMDNPTLTNVIKSLSLSDEDWNKVISGEPLERKVLTEEEKEEKLKKDFEKETFKNISFETYKKYMKNSHLQLIKIIDETVSQSETSFKSYISDNIKDKMNKSEKEVA